MDGALRISTRESLSAPACGPLHMLGAWGRCRRDTAKQARPDAQGDRPDSVGMPEADRSHGHAQADGRDGGSCPSRVRLMRHRHMHGSLRGWPPVSRHTAHAFAAVLWHNRRGMGGGSVLDVEMTMLDKQSKGVPIDEQANDDVVHLDRFREADRLPDQAFDPCA
jgi:hypothetical protein